MHSLTELDVSNFDTSNVDNMSYMFFNISNLTELDISSFDMRGVDNIATSCIFCNTGNLQRLTLGDNVRLNTNMLLPAINAQGYTGAWIGENTGTRFSSSNTLLSQWNTRRVPDTYVWERIK